MTLDELRVLDLPVPAIYFEAAVVGVLRVLPPLLEDRVEHDWLLHCIEVENGKLGQVTLPVLDDEVSRVPETLLWVIDEAPMLPWLGECCEHEHPVRVDSVVLLDEVYPERVFRVDHAVQDLVAPFPLVVQGVPLIEPVVLAEVLQDLVIALLVEL